MNNNHRANPTKYTNAIDTMMSLIERDHGGCDDLECSMANMLNDDQSMTEEMIHWWACSGAACNEFSDLYEEHKQAILEAIDYDPTPWCSGCNAMTQQKCKCGPIAEND
jgi:hypothetical protein